MNVNTTPGRLCWLVPLSLFVFGAGSLPASTIFASAGSLAKASDTSTGTKTWSYNPPAAGASITWIAGIDSEDSHNNPDPAQNEGTETYFGPGNGAKPFAGFGPIDFGGALPAKSIATNSGSGHSSVVVTPDPHSHTNYTADWSITATGTLGNGPGNRNWHSLTLAQDPWNLDTSDFIGFTGPTYDLYFMSGIDSANISPTGSFDLDVYYQTADFTMDLLNVGGGIGGVTVTMNPYPGLQIFQLTDENEGAEDLTGSPLTAGQIQSLFQGVVDTGQLTSPALFGFVLDGLSIPTQDMGGGVVAAMHADSSVTDNASTINPNNPTPEPAAFLLMGGGLLALSAYGRRRRRT